MRAHSKFISPKTKIKQNKIKKNNLTSNPGTKWIKIICIIQLFHSQLISDINKRKEESFILSVVSEIPVLDCEDSMPLELLLWSELWKSICISLERKSKSKEEVPAKTSRICTVNYPFQWEQPSQKSLLPSKSIPATKDQKSHAWDSGGFFLFKP